MLFLSCAIKSAFHAIYFDVIIAIYSQIMFNSIFYSDVQTIYIICFQLFQCYYQLSIICLKKISNYVWKFQILFGNFKFVSKICYFCLKNFNFCLKIKVLFKNLNFCFKIFKFYLKFLNLV